MTKACDRLNLSVLNCDIVSCFNCTSVMNAVTKMKKIQAIAVSEIGIPKKKAQPE